MSVVLTLWYYEYSITVLTGNIITDVKTIAIRQQLKQLLYETWTFMKVGCNPFSRLPGEK